MLASHIGLKNPDALKDLPNFHAWGRFLQSGNPSSPLLLATKPPPDPLNPKGRELIEDSRIRFGRPRASVEARIEAFLQKSEPKPRKLPWRW